MEVVELVIHWIGGLFSWIWDEIAAWIHRRREKNEDPTKCLSCRYSLEGTLQAAINRCPECGTRIARWQRAEWRHNRG